jgi:transcriptional regulator with GAF, ATPase, and Fis domain
LNVLPIMLPPLRERVDDIPELCEYFLSLLRGSDDQDQRLFRRGHRLISRLFLAGNVRELKSVIQRALYICEDEVSRPNICMDFCPSTAEEGEDDKPDEPPPTPGSLEKEIAQLERARSATPWNVTIEPVAGGGRVGDHPQDIARKIKKYNL